MTHHLCIHCVPSFWKQAMNINDVSSTSAISHVPAFRMNLTAISFPESSFPLTSGSGNERLWDNLFRMTRFLSWTPVRRRRRNAKMAKRVEDWFHDGMQFCSAKLGYPNLEVKKEQYDVIEAITYLCAECVTKGLCYQVCLGFSIKICVVWRCKADCVAAECTDPGSVSKIKRLSLFCKASWKMKEMETPDSETRFSPKQ